MREELLRPEPIPGDEIVEDGRAPASAARTSSSGRPSSRSTCRSSSRRRARGVRPPTTSSSPGRPASARPRWRTSSPPSSACDCTSRRARPSSAPATSPRCSRTSTRATSCSSTRSTGWRAPSKRCSIRRWRTSSSTSCSARVRPLDRSVSTLPRFTLVGATTRTGLITGPLRDRFGLVARLDYYDVDDLETIVVRAAGILGVQVDDRGANEIARRAARHPPHRQPAAAPQSATSPRCARGGIVDGATAHEGLTVFGVDERGLDKVDRAVLERTVRPFRRRTGRLEDPCDRGRRARRDGRRRLRAVPHPARVC